MKRKFSIGLVALVILLVAGIAYAATHINLGSLIFGNRQPTANQTEYVDQGMQFIPISQVKAGGQSRDDYQSKNLKNIPVDAAYIQDIAAFMDGTRLVIGFLKADVAKDYSFTCDGFYANDMPLSGGLLQEQQGDQTIFMLDSQLPKELVDKPLLITLPVAAYDQGSRVDYQYISFELQNTPVPSTPESAIKLSEQMSIILLRGSFSPLGFRTSYKMMPGEKVSFIVNTSCAIDGTEYDQPFHGSTDEADELLVFHVDQMPKQLSLRVEWQETDGLDVYACEGTAVFDLSEGTARVEDSKREQVYTLSGTNDNPVFVQTSGLVFDESAEPIAYVLQPYVFDQAKLLDVSKDVLGENILALPTVDVHEDDDRLAITYYRDETKQAIAGNCEYVKTSGEIRMANALVQTTENWLGNVDAPNCVLTREDAMKASAQFLSRFGYTQDELRLENIQAFVGNGQGGYYLYINILDRGTPRFAERYPSNGEQNVLTEWRITVTEQGVSEASGRACEIADMRSIENPLTWQQAQELMESAITKGEFPGISTEYEIVAVRAVSIDPSGTVWEGLSKRVPVWEFDVVQKDENVDGWPSQICIDRESGRVFDANQEKYMEMVIEP